MIDDPFEGKAILVYDLSIPLEKRVAIEFPTQRLASVYLGISEKRINNALNPLKKRKILSPIHNKEFAVRLKKSKQN